MAFIYKSKHVKRCTDRSKAMATAPSPTTMGTYSSLISTNSFSTFLPNKSQLSLSGKSKHCVARRSSISCKATNNNNSNNQNEQQEESSRLLGKLDRRNILIGLSGLYGATALDPKPFAFADPIAPPDLSTCKPAEITTGGSETVPCCPPVTTKIKTFEPDLSIPLRTRPAAHQVTDEYLAKFKKAQAAMRALPDDDPRSMVQQAKVHCAYCNGAYPQVGFTDNDIQVHFSWLFFPFHRMYLYFYERILGKLIDDPTFALPYWNWDSPVGRFLISFFVIILLLIKWYVCMVKLRMYTLYCQHKHLSPKISRKISICHCIFLKNLSQYFCIFSYGSLKLSSSL